MALPKRERERKREPFVDKMKRRIIIMEMTIQLGITSKGKAEQLFFIVDLDNNMARNVVDSKEKKNEEKMTFLTTLKLFSAATKRSRTKNYGQGES